MRNKLKHARKNEGLTQAWVAKKVGIDERTYQRYEADECIPSTTTAIKIAKALNSTVEELFDTTR